MISGQVGTGETVIEKVSKRLDSNIEKMKAATGMLLKIYQEDPAPPPGSSRVLVIFICRLLGCYQTGCVLP